MIGAVFRGGDKHSNHSDTAPKTLRNLIQKIRRHYREDVPIIVRADSGFFDQKLMADLEALGVGPRGGTDDLQRFISGVGESSWGTYQNGDQEWRYVELGDRRGNWKKFRRALFRQPLYEDRQRLLEFRPDQILYTNLGCGSRVDEELRAAGLERWLEADNCWKATMGGEPTSWCIGLKDFPPRPCPSSAIRPTPPFTTRCWWPFSCTSRSRQDVCDPVVPLSCYATTLRRRLLDVAGKIVRHAGQILLKVTTATWEQLQIRRLWEKSGNPPAFGWT